MNQQFPNEISANRMTFLQ